MIWRLPPTLALLALLSGGPALGAVADPRVRTLQYDPDQVYRIVGVVRSATQIVFSSTETIEHVALGDSATWEAAPQDQVLFLKPLVTGRPTNLIVTTRLGSLQRHYAFELVTRSGSIGRSTAETYFQVRFSYPADQRAELDRALAAETAALEQQVLQLKLDRAVLEGPRNLSYEVQGAQALAPSEVSDNGRFTVLRFPANQPLPALYIVTTDGTETLAPFDVRGEFVVVHAVTPQLRLRRGRQTLCIFNTAYDPHGVNSGLGTAASDVERVIQPERRH